MTEDKKAADGASSGVSDSTQLLGATDSKTLAKWWCLLNRWDWPKELGEAEPRDAPQPKKRTELMNEISRIIGHKECLREWNKDSMLGETFDTWYAGNFRRT